jgi:hypothetical protein
MHWQGTVVVCLGGRYHGWARRALLRALERHAPRLFEMVSVNSFRKSLSRTPPPALVPVERRDANKTGCTHPLVVKLYRTSFFIARQDVCSLRDCVSVARCGR